MMKKDTTAYGAERPAWDKSDCSVRALAVVDGVVHDWEGTSRGATCLTRVYRVTEVARAKMAKMGELLV